MNSRLCWNRLGVVAVCLLLVVLSSIVYGLSNFTASSGSLVLFHVRELIYKPFDKYGHFYGWIISSRPLSWSVLNHVTETSYHAVSFLYYGHFIEPPSILGASTWQNMLTFMSDFNGTYLSYNAMILARTMPVTVHNYHLIGTWFGFSAPYPTDTVLDWVNGNVVCLALGVPDYEYNGMNIIVLPLGFVMMGAAPLPDIRIPWLKYWKEYDFQNVWFTTMDGQPLHYALLSGYREAGLAYFVVQLPATLNAGESILIKVCFSRDGSNPYASYRDPTLIDDVLDGEIIRPSSPSSTLLPITVVNPTPYSYTNYPVMIVLNSTNFNEWNLIQCSSVIDPSTVNFYPTNIEGNPLYYWVEYCNTTAKLLILWINLPHLYAYSHTIIYLHLNTTPPTGYLNGSKVFTIYVDYIKHEFNTKFYFTNTSIYNVYIESNNVYFKNVESYFGCEIDGYFEKKVPNLNYMYILIANITNSINTGVFVGAPSPPSLPEQDCANLFTSYGYLLAVQAGSYFTLWYHDGGGYVGIGSVEYTITPQGHIAIYHAAVSNVYDNKIFFKGYVILAETGQIVLNFLKSEIRNVPRAEYYPILREFVGHLYVFAYAKYNLFVRVFVGWDAPIVLSFINISDSSYGSCRAMVSSANISSVPFEVLYIRGADNISSAIFNYQYLVWHDYILNRTEVIGSVSFYFNASVNDPTLYIVHDDGAIVYVNGTEVCSWWFGTPWDISRCVLPITAGETVEVTIVWTDYCYGGILLWFLVREGTLFGITSSHLFPEMNPIYGEGFPIINYTSSDYYAYYVEYLQWNPITKIGKTGREWWGYINSLETWKGDTYGRDIGPLPPAQFLPYLNTSYYLVFLPRDTALMGKHVYTGDVGDMYRPDIGLALELLIISNITWEPTNYTKINNIPLKDLDLLIDPSYIAEKHMIIFAGSSTGIVPVLMNIDYNTLHGEETVSGETVKYGIWFIPTSHPLAIVIYDGEPSQKFM